MPTVFIDESGRYKLVKIENPSPENKKPDSTPKRKYKFNEWLFLIIGLLFCFFMFIYKYYWAH